MTRVPSSARAGLVASLLVSSLALLAAPTTPVGAADQPTGNAEATVETDAVLESGDAADDPAIWVDATDPSRSVVIGSDNAGALEVYDLAGHRIQRIAEGNFGNVDVRQGVPTGTGPKDLVVVHRAGIRVYAMDVSTRQLSNVTDTASGSIPIAFTGDGLCMYRSATSGSTYVFVDAADGRVAQYELVDTDGDGLVEGQLRRSWDVGTAVEGCVADDDRGVLYIAEEDVAIWRYGAEPTAPTTTASRTRVDTTVANGGHIQPDAEGLTLVDLPDGSGYVIVSSQAGSNSANTFLVYDRVTNVFIRSFKIVSGTRADGCNRTDGVAALAADLGPAFPNGIFVCQDGQNTTPAAGFQNFKFVPLERVVGLTQTPPPTSSISFVGAATANASSNRHRVTLPAAVQPGDALLLTFAVNSLATITPPAGWTQLDAVSTSSARSVVWRRVAVAGDAGASVQVQLSATAKASITVLAYRGASTTAPIVARTTGTGTSHTTPTVAAAAGSWVVSMWTHKDASTSTLVPPATVTVRSNGSQTGSGRVTVLVADSGPVSAGNVGGLTATAAASASNAHMWTIVLAPTA